MENDYNCYHSENVFWYVTIQTDMSINSRGVQLDGQIDTVMTAYLR